eukprot:2797866-Rhodomonas_salina.3
MIEQAPGCSLPCVRTEHGLERAEDGKNPCHYPRLIAGAVEKGRWGCYSMRKSKVSTQRKTRAKPCMMSSPTWKCHIALCQCQGGVPLWHHDLVSPNGATMLLGKMEGRTVALEEMV